MCLSQLSDVQADGSGVRVCLLPLATKCGGPFVVALCLFGHFPVPVLWLSPTLPRGHLSWYQGQREGGALSF